MSNNQLTYNRLRELVYYEDGELFWIKTDDRVGSTDNKGYRRVSIDNVRYKVHRLVWYFFHQAWPKQQIDHIDGNKRNNNIENLRDVSQTINLYNKTKAHKNSTASMLGVSLSGSKFVARLRVGNTLIHLGTYNSAKEAHDVYAKKKQEVIDAITASSLD